MYNLWANGPENSLVIHKMYGMDGLISAAQTDVRCNLMKSESHDEHVPSFQSGFYKRSTIEYLESPFQLKGHLLCHYCKYHNTTTH